MMKILLTVFVLLTVLLSSASANPEKAIDRRIHAIDSLLNLVKISANDSNKVKSLIALCSEYKKHHRLDSALYFGNNALLLAKQINFSKGIVASCNLIGRIHESMGDYGKAMENFLFSLKMSDDHGDKNNIAASYIDIGIIYSKQGNYDKALEFLFASRKIEDEIKIEHPDDIKNKSNIATSYSNIGLVYMNQGDYQMALDNFYSSLKIQEETGDKNGISSSYTNIGIIYASQGNYEKALDNFLTSLKISKETEDIRGIADSYLTIGICYKNQANYAKALEFYSQALKTYEKMEDRQRIALTYNNIGGVYANQGNNEKALDNFLTSLKIQEEIDDKQGMAMSYNNIGCMYADMDLIPQAMDFLNKGLALSRKIGTNDLVMQAYEILFKVSEKRNDYKNAYEYHKLYAQIKDTIYNEESNKQITEMQTKYETEKKEQQIKLLNADKEKQAAVSAEQRKRLYIILAGSLLLLIAASGFLNYYVRSNRMQKLANIELSRKNDTIHKQKNEIESQKVIVEQKNRDILDSIEYASRIQQAIIPDEAEMARVLGREFFVFHRQKDIIGGDFYFVTKVHDEILIAVADCTGHGVPGAMLSMLGKDQLNELVNGRGVTEPKTLLEKLDEQITIALNPNRKMEIPDGMDMAVIRLADNVIGFSGANRPLVIVRDGELLEYKGVRTGIGGGGTEKEYNIHTVELKKGNMIYLFTDGYADQAGGPKNKKFKSRLLRDVLKEISSKGMNEQKEILLNTFEKWKGIGEQTDDVTIIGIRI